MNLAIISFTKAGSILNAKIEELLEEKHRCTSYYKGRQDESVSILEVTISLNEWCKNIFKVVDGIIFIGACGIAVRTIAPFIEDKTKDPLVIVIDEKAQFVISLLSGHIGRGNELTWILSDLLKATPVITTATDINHKFAVDVFANKQNLHIADMKMAKEISASILEGKQIGIVSQISLNGCLPEALIDMEFDPIDTDIGICISISEDERPFLHTLCLIPRIVSIGVGCKKGTDVEKFEKYIRDTLKDNQISIHAIKNLASIDLKAEEPCILAFAQQCHLDFITYSANQLKKLPGSFKESEFVKSITGVGNVCERSAIMGSNNGILILEKQSFDGMTIAIAKEMRGINFE
ncbi:MAG: cobalt-precorrin 5A hydrolase [Lachnotalea sp.]